jgi:oligopeptide transport system substrate-binding protein
MRIRTLALSAALASAFVLAACGGGGGGSEADQEAAERTLRRGISANPDTLDPHRSSAAWENIIIGDMFVGLFTEGADGKPIKAIAKDYSVSDDGLTWTFELRDDVTWSDGTPLVAEDFVFSFRRIQEPELGSQYASMLWLIKNAEAVNNGDLPAEEMGIRAEGEHTLIIELEYPAPYLPGLLTHYTTYPVPPHVVREHGLQWTRPENIEVNGPYKLAQWRINDFLSVRRNPEWGMGEGLCFDQVIYYPITDLDAVERLIEEGKLDKNNAFAGQKKATLDERFPGWVRTTPGLVTTYWSFQMEVEPFDDVRVRKALSMALDRDFMVNQVLTPGYIPAYSLVPPGMDNYRPGEAEEVIEWREWPRERRLEEARRLLEEAGFGPDNPLEFSYIYRSTSDNPKVAPVADSNWREIADWVRPSIEMQDTKILYARLRAKDFEVADGAWLADYNDPYNYLYLLESDTGQQNYSNYANPEYDALLTQANATLDTEARIDLMIDAQKIMLADYPITPMWFQVTQNMVDPAITGYEDNANDIHRTQWMCKAGLERR